MEEVIRNYNYIPGDLNYIITNNREIKELNKKFLKHNYATDVISFKYDEGNVINGEVYISIEKVKANARKYRVSVKNELERVLIHGTLHLCGFLDYNEKEREKMRSEENLWIEKFGD
ncbi:MAG TPA: rRNA maturation RNase YbeY [Bacteroidales bacterium]|nr:rRNA maturation RNase YbeY [Bacteroidales bacterium]HPP91806.1 rRNA maturation RNase YbeY [Bacteroidales bacterium]HQK70695.1 rRNA maturation RNase YbeY [Bacteroidales bacterium]HRR15919.1 rRNA maturation RNase YbeY [Bacteroidales bacterium]HRT47997.1 rRNA maturation RNase YbeY [Bacteroidales bacterium]